MTATLIPTSGEAEWLEARRSGITASEIAVVMGLSPYSSPYALFHQKLGNLPPQEDNDAMRIGRHLEELVCEMFAERRPEFYPEGNGRELYADAYWPAKLATPDRLLIEVLTHDDGTWKGYSHNPVAVLEAKTAASYDGWGDDGTDEIPVHYRCQVLWQMDVMDVRTAFVACLFLHSRQLRIYEITLDGQAEQDLVLLRRGASTFLERIKNGEEPDVDWRPATTETLKHLHPSVEDVDVPVKRKPIIAYRSAVKAYKAAEQRKKAAENRLRLLLGDGHRITDERTGEVIARRDVYPVKEHVRKATTVDKLVPVKAKEITAS
jgi:putative phage-type endonuclease